MEVVGVRIRVERINYDIVQSCSESTSIIRAKFLGH